MLRPSFQLLLALLPLTQAKPLVARQANNTVAPSSSASATATTAAALPTATFYPSENTPVEVTGLNFPGQEIYLGIPFAAAPTGSLRFTPPQPASYNDTFNANTQVPGCLQAPTTYPVSEDCLQLNIFKPAGYGDTGPQIPVMVWVYGGSFTGGSAAVYNGSGIVAFSVAVQKPVIFVAFNYRLGIFGFGTGEEFAANGAANLGLRDQLAALQWVQDNIWAWGGDATKVTIFGESAGAISIADLFLNPDINLFRSAIMESGAQSTAPIGPTNTTWQAPYDAIVNLTNCSPSTNLTISSAQANQSTFDCLKALPAAALLNATLAVKKLPQFQAGFIFAPTVDGDLIPDSPHALLAEGKFAKIPFISGNNLDEGTAFVPTAIASESQLGQYLDLVEPIPLNSTFIGDLLQLYPDVPALGSPFGTGNQTFNLSSVYKQASALVGDATFQSQRRWFLQQANANGLNQTWTYSFAQNSPVSASYPAYLGVFHGSEVIFVFQGVTTAGGYTAGDVALGQTMLNYWLNFVYFTDPNGPATGNSTTLNWPAHAYSGNRSMIEFISGNVSIIPDTYRATQMDFFNGQPKAFNYRRSISG